MPSAAKRRKAAAAKQKKNQEEAPAGSEACSFDGGEDLKGLETDGGEAGLQTGGPSFSEEAGGDKGGPPIRQNASEKGDVEEVVSGEEVEVLKVDDDETVEVLGNKDLGFVFGDSGGGYLGSSSNSSRSDDEKTDVEETQVVPDSVEVEEVYPVFESVLDFPGPDLAVEEVVIMSEAPHVAETYKDLDKRVLSESNYGTQAAAANVLPALPTASLSHGQSSNVDSSDVKNAEDKLLPPSDSPVAVGHLKDLEIQDATETQTPAPQVPLPLQRTSWKSCCGLFEVFTGSR